MEISGSRKFDAPQQLVWEVLIDPDTLKRTLPGCQKFEPLGDGKYDISMSIGIAAIKGTYSGTVQLLNEQPPDSYTLKVSAKGAVGFIDGQGDFKLAPVEGDSKTELNYTGQAQVGGKIAGVGQRLLHAGANLVIGMFFKALEKEVAKRKEGKSPAARKNA
jgi:carbon monoxide dehydrogenase subunit G